MAGDQELQLSIQGDRCVYTVVIARDVLTGLTGRTHLTPEEVANAYRTEIEYIARAKLKGSDNVRIRLSAADFCQ